MAFYYLFYRFPSILQSLEREIVKFNATAIPPSNMPADPNSNPKFWDHTWNNFGDYPPPVVTTTSTEETMSFINSD